MKWPALYGRKSGTIKIQNFMIEYSGNDGFGVAVEIPVNQLVIKVRGRNTPVFHLIDRYNPQIRLIVQSREPIEILARRGIHEAAGALRGQRRKHGTKILTYILPFVVVALFLFALPYLFAAAPVEWLDTVIPPASERAIGTKILQRYQDEFLIEAKNPANGPLQALVSEIVKANPSLSEFQPQVLYSRSPDINAFTLAGGYIVCNRGLIDKAESLEEIAGVLAHELGHVQLRHVTRSLLSSVGTAGTVLLLSAVIGGDTASLLSDFAGVLRLKYSRQQEQRADDRAFTLLLKAKISPKGLISFFRRLEAEGSNLPPGFGILSTHPLTRDRIDAIQAKLTAAKDTEWVQPPGSLEQLKRQLGTTR